MRAVLAIFVVTCLLVLLLLLMRPQQHAAGALRLTASVELSGLGAASLSPPPSRTAAAEMMPRVRRGRLLLSKANGGEDLLCYENVSNCVSLATIGSVDVSDAALGVRLHFNTPRAPRADAGLRTAVVSSGHLRTYRQCTPSLLDRIVRPNKADLFLITYSYLAIQLLNESVPPATQYIDINHVVLSHAPFLRQIYLFDDAKVKRAVRAAFPKHAAEYQGLLSKMLTLEVGMQMIGGAGEQLHVPIPYDVVVKVRPDIFIIGNLVFFAGSERSRGNVSMNVHFTCVGAAAEYPSVQLQADAIFRSPHHPTLLWPGDPYSDHAVFGTVTAMSRFGSMFSTLERLQSDAPTIGMYLFTRHSLQNTPEKVWATFATQVRLREVFFVGYHILLRDAEQFTRGANVREALKNSRLKKALLIFGITDPKVAPCPDPSGRLRPLPSTHSRAAARRRGS
jgi:hypothetical protein